MIERNIKSTPPPQVRKAARQRLRIVHQDQPQSTKKPRTIVPPPQSARIMQRYIDGKSIRQIAREEQRDRATVTKIVRSDEMQSFVQKMRERFYGLAFDAMNAVEHSLQQQNDARLGYRILSDIGIVPSVGERYSITTQPPCIDKSNDASRTSYGGGRRREHKSGRLWSGLRDGGERKSVRYRVTHGGR